MRPRAARRHDAATTRRDSRSRERRMALCFAFGSACFLIGPFPGYIDLVGPAADAVTFFVGSILFTAGAALQTLLAAPERRSPGAGRAAWWAATVQSVGTLFFNVTTYQAMHAALGDPDYDRLVWRPDALGSICFLVSGRSRIAPPIGAGGGRCAAAPGGGSRRSTCSAASSSVSRRSRATSCRRPGRRSTWPPRTGTRPRERRAS
jgi:hypothetical protein